MKLIALIVGLSTTVMGFAQQYSKVKIHTDTEGLRTLAEMGVGIDHGEHKPGYFFISDFSQEDIAIMEANGFSYEIIIPDVKAHYVNQNNAGSEAKNVACTSASGGGFTPQTPANFYMNNTYGGFYKYQDMLDALDDMVAMYPNLITVKAPIGSFLTHENRPVYFVKISDDPNSDDASEPNVLHTAIHHAREPLSMSQLMFYMWYLLENYATSEEIQHLVNNTEIYFVPCLNPDGYIHNEVNDPSGGGMHRKNKAPVGSSNPGVDLNRNYSYQFNTTGVSPNPDNDTYPGSAAFSEPETQAIKWFVEQHGFQSAYNAHTYGQTLLFPIGATEAEFADHHDYFNDLSVHMCSHNGYFPQKSSGLYPASGDSDDYMYKVDIGVGAKDTIFSWTPEIGTDFWPASSEVIPTSQGMVFSNMVLSHMTHQYVVVKDQDPYLVGTTSGNFNHNALRLGLVDGPVTVSIEPLLNIQSVGAPVIHDLALRANANGAISYDLVSGLQYGDPIKYVLNTTYASWTFRDTIEKMYGTMTLQFADDASTNTNWTGNWSQTDDAAYSPTMSFTESDGGDYANNISRTYTLSQSIDLTNATAAQVTFYAKWEIEADYDYCQFQVSTNGGANWIGQCANYTVTGSSTPWNGSAQPNGEPVWEGTSDWVYEEVSLSEYLGQSIKVRFKFESDNGVAQDGFYFDDFKVSFNDDTSGLDELNPDGMKLMVHPNPASNSATFSFSRDVNSGSIAVVDQTGKQVGMYVIHSNTKNVNLDLGALPAGVYMLRYTDGENTFAPVKMIVIK